MFKKREKEKKPKDLKIKKVEEKEYIMKKTAHLKVFRIVFWVLLISVFFLGVKSIFKLNTQLDPEEIIKEVKVEESKKPKQEEIFSFAENFTRQYVTYTKDGEDSFLARIKPYVSERILETQNIYDFKTASNANYVNAYRLEPYSETQFNVYVTVSASTVSFEEVKDKKKQETIKTPKTFGANYTLKVPISITNKSYVVEDLPMIVSDSSYYGNKDYEVKLMQSEEVKVDGLEESLMNFLKAYYKEDQTVIDYYLDAGADKTKFCSLIDTAIFNFEKITELKIYQAANGKDYICLVKFNLINKNTKGVILQQFNLIVRQDSSKGKQKFYIKDIEPRTNNIKQ